VPLLDLNVTFRENRDKDGKSEISFPLGGKVDRFAQIEFFVAVADGGSLGRAAVPSASQMRRRAGCSPRSESRLGARLVERNTRRLYLTEEGLSFLPRARSILSDLADAEAALTETVLDRAGSCA
jgi:hypothetical protein